jgi:cation diffusion facilitator CzcD-associated flavoprotein CzcO
VIRRAEIVVIGAGPYGLSAAAHLRRAGAECQVFGEPMSFWRTMPAGMRLRSNRSATNIAERNGTLSLDAFERVTGASVTTPVPLEQFIAYGEWVQRRAVPDVDRRTVSYSAAALARAVTGRAQPVPTPLAASSAPALAETERV